MTKNNRYVKINNMVNIEIRFALEQESMDISKLSQKFALENSCNGIIADNSDYFKNKNVAVAIANNEIVGYCYGNVCIEDKNRSFAKKEDKYFDLAEIYILPKFRNFGIGEKLYNFIETYAKENLCKTIRLNAVSKDYKKLLSFYIDKLNMAFWSAFLIKYIK